MKDPNYKQIGKAIAVVGDLDNGLQVSRVRRLDRSKAVAIRIAIEGQELTLVVDSYMAVNIASAIQGAAYKNGEC